MSTPPPSPRGRFAWLLFLLVGLLAGGLGGWIGDERRDDFDLSPELQKEWEEHRGANPSPELAEKTRQEDFQNDRKRAMLIVGLSGAILGGVFGLCLGLVQSSWIKTISGLVLGTILGGAAGATGGFASDLVAKKIPIHEMDEFVRAMLIHAAAWAPLGLAVGLTIGGVSRSGLGGFFKSSLGVFFAGAVGGAVFPILAMYFFPDDATDRTLPKQRETMMFWVALVGAITGLAAGRFAGSFPNSTNETKTAPA